MRLNYKFIMHILSLPFVTMLSTTSVALTFKCYDSKEKPSYVHCNSGRYCQCSLNVVLLSTRHNQNYARPETRSGRSCFVMVS